MTIQEIGGLSQEQASGIQAIYKKNIAGGMTPAEAQAAIKADPSFAKAKAAYQTPVAGQAPTTIQEGTQPIAQPQPVQPSPGVVIPPPIEQAPKAQKTPVNTEAIKQNADGNRDNEIVTNLNEGFKNDLAINKAISTGDYNTYKTAYSYDTSDSRKKELLDAFFQARQPKDEGGIFQILKTGQKVMNPQVVSSPEYTKANAKYGIYSKLSGMSSSQLLTEMKNGNIGTEMARELMADPEFQIAKQQYGSWKATDDINKSASAALGVISGKTKAEENALQKMSDKALSGVDPEQYTSLQSYMKVKAPELTEKVTSYNAKNQTLRELSDERDNMLRTVIKDHPGISKGAAMVLASRNNESLNDQIKSMSYSLQTEQADINYATEILKEDFKASQKIQEEDRQFSRQKELAKYQSDLSLAENQAEFEQEVRQKAELATNPILATQDLIDSYRKMGIIAERSDADIIASVQRDIARGKSIGESLTALNKAFQSKPIYKAMMAPKTELKEFGNNLYKVDANGNMSLAMKGAVSAADMKFTKLDDGLYQDSQGNIVTKAEIAQEKLLNNKWLNMEVGTDAGVECGVFSSRGSGLTSTPGGNNLDARKKAFSSKDAVPGGLVLFNGGGYDKTYGHIAIVTSVNQDGTINVKESNYHGDNKVTERNNVPTTYVSGYYNATPLAGGNGGSTSGNDRFLIFEEADKLKGKSRSDYLADSGLTIADYNSINEEIRGKERNFSEISNTYRSLLSLGGGVSDSDKQDVMQSYYDALYADDKEGMIQATKRAVSRNKEIGPAIATYETTVSNLTRLTNGLEKYITAGGSTDIFEGTLENVIQKLGNTSDVNLAEIKAGMEQLQAQYIKAQSGTAASDQERRFLLGVMPSISNLSNLNNAKVKALGKSAKDTLMGTMKGSLYGSEEFLDKYIAPDYSLQFDTKTIKGTPVTTVKRTFVPKVTEPTIQYKSTSGKTYNF